MTMAIMVLAIRIQAQETKKEKKPREKDLISLDFNLDYSFVLGKYGQYDKSVKESGYAANGWVAMLGFNWLGKRGWGLAVQTALQHNPYQDTAVNAVPWGVKYPLGNNGWYNIYLMAGPAYIHAFGPWELNVKAFAGLLLSQSSNFNVTSPVDTSNVRLTGSGWAYGGSVTFGYKISKNFGINLNVNYLGGIPKASKKYGSQVVGYEEVVDPDTGLITYVPITTGETKYEIKKAVSTVNVGIGVIYHF
jgi:hypothetical protein